MSFGKVADHVTSGFFKPSEHMNNLALLVEPKSIARGVTSEYNGQTRVRDEVVADVAIFDNQADLDAKKPSSILKAVKIVHTLLTKDTEHFIPDGAICVRLKKVSTKGGSAYAFEDISDAATLEAVKGFYDARSEAVASAPSFD